MIWTIILRFQIADISEEGMLLFYMDSMHFHQQSPPTSNTSRVVVVVMPLSHLARRDTDQ
jgi:hypothetical protein